MVIWIKVIAAAALLLACAPSFAQEPDDELDARMREAEARLEMEAKAMESAQEAREMRRAEQRSHAEILESEVRMREAERRMSEAARQMADLSMAQLPPVERIERIIRANRGPVLGVTIGATKSVEPVKGVELLGVTPGGAAEESGLRAGDTITSINGEDLAADSGEAATKKMLAFMQGVEEGDELEIAYMRNGKNASVELTPRPIENNVFAFEFDGENFTSPDIEVHVAPHVGEVSRGFVWAMHDDGFGSMEMVKLTENLGSYFGTTEGLLVVRAPENEDLKLEDGDVILSIDGRTPNSVSHALRILSSYSGGEELKIEIMREKRKRTIKIEMPDNRRSWVKPAVVAPQAGVAPVPSVAPSPDVAPAPPVAPSPGVSPVRVIATGNERI